MYLTRYDNANNAYDVILLKERRNEILQKRIPCSFGKHEILIIFNLSILYFITMLIFINVYTFNLNINELTI